MHWFAYIGPNPPCSGKRTQLPTVKQNSNYSEWCVSMFLL